MAGGSVWLEWLRILAINLVVMLGVLVPANLLRTRAGYPLGYGSVAAIVPVCGVTLGTNSFTLSMGGKVPPSFAVFGSSGVYEITAYVLAVAGTVPISRWRVTRWRMTGKTTEAIVPSEDGAVLRERNTGVALAIAILVVTCGWEAYRVSMALPS